MRPFLRPDFPMNDQKYDRINTLASKEADRRSVADRVASFIAAGGTVKAVDHTANQSIEQARLRPEADCAHRQPQEAAGMSAEFKTTEELQALLRAERDSLARLQDAEPTWRREDRPRGLRNIERVRNRIAAIEAELKMAKGR